MTELKPCPFCGGEANKETIHLQHEANVLWIECSNCDSRTHRFIFYEFGGANYGQALRDATDAWNTRQPAINWQPISDLQVKEGLHAIFTSVNRAFSITPYLLVGSEYEVFYLNKNYTHFIEITPPNS